MKILEDRKYCEGESVIFEIRPSIFTIIIYLVPLLLAIVGIMVVLGVAGLTFFWVYLIIALAGLFVGAVIVANWYFTIYRLTDRRVENRTGIFGSREEEITHDDIQSIDIVRTIWGEIFGFGTVVIEAAGEKREVYFTNVARSREIAHKITDYSTPHQEQKVDQQGSRF